MLDELSANCPICGDSPCPLYGTRLSHERPDDDLIGEAKKAVRMVVLDTEPLNNDPDELHWNARSLVEKVRGQNHALAAIEWAIRDFHLAGLLTVEPIPTELPSGEPATIGFPTEGPISFRTYRLRPAKSLYTWRPPSMQHLQAYRDAQTRALIAEIGGLPEVRILDPNDRPESPDVAPVGAEVKPQWDANSGRVLVAGRVARRVAKSAHRVRPLLDALEKGGWAGKTASPFGDRSDVHHEAIRSFNEKSEILKLSSDGTQMIEWEVKSPEELP